MARLPSYRLHKASGQGVTTIQGRDYYFGPFGHKDSKQKYRKLLAEYLSSGQSTTFGVQSSSLTMASVAVSYLKHAKVYYLNSTEPANIKLALVPISELYSDHLAIEFGPNEFRTVRNWWVKKGSSRQYVNKQSKRLIAMLKWAVSEGMIPPSVHQAVKCVDPLKRGRTDAREAPPIRPVTDSVVDATLPFLSPVVADMVRFQRLVGCRPGEVCSLKPSMVDRTGGVWEINLEKHKTAWRGKARTLYVGPQAQNVLRPYLLRSADDYCFSPKEAEKQRLAAKHEARKTPLSCGNRPGSNVLRKPSVKPGDHYTTQSYARSIGYASLKAFRPSKELSEPAKKAWSREHSWAPNQLRHSMATRVRKSDGIEVASILLGHSEIGVTQVYAEADRTKAIEVVRRIG